VKILLTGRSGQVGSALEPLLARAGELAAFDRAGLDLADTAALRARVAAEKPAVIVNAAAYTAVDRAETERAAAFAANAEAVGVLAEEAVHLGALLIHFSTDYVFDGSKQLPYAEDDATHPLNVYGESKLAGERAVAGSGCRHVILRTSWVYAGRGRNFLLSILNAARTGRSLTVVNDQRGAPTSARMIANAVVGVLSARDQPSGLYHLSAAGETTWFGFAQEILARKGLTTPITPISSASYGTVARRPANSLLDNNKLRAAFGIALPDWREGLAAVLTTIN
jgi:dTDP-4-dehydrorhamnose reductase